MNTLESIVVLIAVTLIVYTVIEWLSMPFKLNSIEKKLDKIIEIMKER